MGTSSSNLDDAGILLVRLCFRLGRPGEREDFFWRRGVFSPGSSAVGSMEIGKDMALVVDAVVVG
jgi:hypothetical protein